MVTNRYNTDRFEDVIYLDESLLIQIQNNGDRANKSAGEHKIKEMVKKDRNLSSLEV